METLDYGGHHADVTTPKEEFTIELFADMMTFYVRNANSLSPDEREDFARLDHAANAGQLVSWVKNIHITGCMGDLTAIDLANIIRNTDEASLSDLLKKTRLHPRIINEKLNAITAQAERTRSALAESPAILFRNGEGNFTALGEDAKAIARKLALMPDDTLLDILCALLPKDKTVSFPDRSFQKGISRFENYGFDVHFRDKDATIIYVSPSHMTRFGDVMPMKRRLELVEYSEANAALVLEDDYDNDFLYASRPTPSLYALATADNVVYMSSFANVLTPGIRISFMVLPRVLANAYHEQIWRFSQTASKTEQIALCGYIRDGHIGAQIRKIRRFATAKTRRFHELLRDNLTYEECRVSENGLQVRLTVPFTGTKEDFDAVGLSVFWESFDGHTAHLTLLPSALPEADFPEALKAFRQVLGQN